MGKTLAENESNKAWRTTLKKTTNVVKNNTNK